MHLRSTTNYLSNTSDNHFHELRSGNIYYRGNVEPTLPSFQDWKSSVDNILIQEFDVKSDELPDFPYYDCYIENMEPIQVANHVRGKVYEYLETEASYQRFLDWQTQVDTLVLQHLEIPRLDLPDFPFYDCYIGGIEPIQMVNYMHQQLQF
jgi:hypothetical protein